MSTELRRDPDWNWVKSRAECSAVAMFEHLRIGALANLAERNATIQEPGRVSDRFQLTETNKGRLFTVFDSWGQDRRAVDFSLDLETIHVGVHLPSASEFQATLTLNNEGLCKFKVGDDELDTWQVLKKALESLLFEAER